MTHAAAGRAVAAFCTAFCLGQLGGTFIVDRCAVEVRFPEMRRILDEARRLPSRPDVAVFGSSRMMEAVRAKEASLLLARTGSHGISVVNAAVPLGDFLVVEPLVDGLRTEGRLPRIAVLEISPETVSRRNYWLRGAVDRTFTWAEIVRLFPELIRAHAGSELAASRLIPFHHHRADILEWAGCRLPSQPTPHLQNPPPEEPPAEMSRALASSLGKWLRDYETGGLSAEALDRILDVFRTAGTTVVLLAPPVSSPYRAAYDPAVEQAFRAFLEARTQGTEVRYFDARAFLPDRLFRDGHHVNPEGAVRFTEILASDVIAPSLRLSPAAAPPGEASRTVPDPRGARR